MRIPMFKNLADNSLYSFVGSSKNRRDEARKKNGQMYVRIDGSETMDVYTRGWCNCVYKNAFLHWFSLGNVEWIIHAQKAHLQSLAE